ncbi:MAG: cation:proton antiporter [Oceanicaulis sp.]
MAVEGHDVWLKDAAVFLVAAGVVVPAFKRLKISAVLGFLIAGVALGPYALGGLSERWPVLDWVTISNPEAAAPFAELGVLFLLFLLGLELSFQRLWALRRAVFGAGGLQSGLSALAIGAACVWIGLAAPAAVVVGLALALSSTAIVMQILAEERRAATPVGRASLAVLLMQDILVAPILILTGFLARDTLGSGGVGVVLLEALVQGAIAIGVIIFAGRYLLKPVFRLAAKAGGRDLMMAIVFATVVGASLLTAEAGLSLALGAFLAGLLLGETEFKHQAEVDLEPFKGLLLGVFFTTVGLSLDLGAVWANFAVVIGGLFAMLAVKLIIAYAALRLFAGGRGLSIEAAFLLAPAGEFVFVILAAAGAGGVVDRETATIVSAIAGLSMLLTPAMGKLGKLAAARFAPEPTPDAPGIEDFSELEGHVVIAGMGRVGRAIARVLETEQVEIIGLDRNAARVAHARRDGWRAYYGDASHPEILAKAGARGAELFAVTVDDPDKACAMVGAIRELRSDAPILARARDGEHAVRLMKAGATHVTPEAIEAALQLAGRALEAFGLPPETVRDRLAQEREDEYARGASEG